MPKKLSREQRLAERRVWMNSPRSLNGRLARFKRMADAEERRLLLDCIKRGLGVKGAAKFLHTYPNRIKYLLRKHHLRFPTQPSEEEMKEQSERQAKKRKEAASKDPLAQLGERLEAEGRFDRPNRKAAEPERVEAFVVPAKPVTPSRDALRKFCRQVLTEAKYPECGHPIEMDSEVWLTPEVFACAKCALAPRAIGPERPAPKLSTHCDRLAEIAAQHGL